MCISIPARIVEITLGAMPMARVDVGGQPESCCLSYLPDAAVGDYVLVQHGFAVELLDPQSAAESLAAFVALGIVRDDADLPGPAVDEPRLAAPETEGPGRVRYAQVAGTGPAPDAAPDQG